MASSATLHRPTSRKNFEQDLLAKYPVGVARNIYHENQYDGTPPQKLSLYYEILDTPDKDGLTERHCGTWTKGKGWEFLRTQPTGYYTNENGDDLSNCCDAFLTACEDEAGKPLCCKKCWNAVESIPR